jgi:hypothetical protein
LPCEFVHIDLFLNTIQVDVEGIILTGIRGEVTGKPMLSQFLCYLMQDLSLRERREKRIVELCIIECVTQIARSNMGDNLGVCITGILRVHKTCKVDLLVMVQD